MNNVLSQKITIALGLLLLVCFSRGILQLAFSKNIALVIQFLSIIIFISYTLSLSVIIKYLLKPEYILFWLIVIFSIILTVLNHDHFGVFWLSIPIIIFVLSIFVREEIFLNKINYTLLKNIIISLFIFLILFGVMQSNGFILDYLPADNSFLKRPSSVTSSYLHYPIIISTISIVFLYIYVRNNAVNNLYLILFLIGLSVVFIAESRYGMLQIILGIFILLCKKRIWTFFLVSFLIATLCLLDNDIKERLLNAYSINSIGNNDRLNTWFLMLDKISILDFVLGRNFGIFSNSINLFPNLINVNVVVTESSLLLLILNFGIIGGLFCLYIIGKLYTNNLLIFFILIIPSIFYQSIETIPYILIICLTPILIRMK